MSSPSSSNGSGDRLTAEEHASLEELGLCFKAIPGGKRKVSGTFISPPHTNLSSSNSSTNASPTGLISFKNHSLPANIQIDLPDEAESIEALEWIGLTEKAALKVFTQWQNRSIMSPSTLLDFTIGYTFQLRLTPYHGLSTTEAMTKLGIRHRTLLAIWLPTSLACVTVRIFWHEWTRYYMETG